MALTKNNKLFSKVFNFRLCFFSFFQADLREGIRHSVNRLEKFMTQTAERWFSHHHVPPDTVKRLWSPQKHTDCFPYDTSSEMTCHVCVPGATLAMRPTSIALEDIVEWRQTPPPISSTQGSFRLRRGSRFTWRKECLAVMERWEDVVNRVNGQDRTLWVVPG